MEYILETENINKKYGQFNALNNLNMHIPFYSICKSL